MVSEYVHQVRHSPGLITITSLAPALTASDNQDLGPPGDQAWAPPAANYAFKFANMKFADNRVTPERGLCYISRNLDVILDF